MADLFSFPRPHRASLRFLVSAIPFVVVSLLLASCDSASFEPSGEYRSRVQAPPPISVQLTAPSDTIQAWGEAELDFSIDLNGNTFEYVAAEIGDVYVGNATGGRTILVNTTLVEDGVHDLTLTFTVKSGAQSLAAGLGVENGRYVWEGVIDVDNSPPAPVSVQSASPVDGALQVTWDRVPEGRIGFQRYDVYHVDPTSFGATPFASIRNPDVTSVADTLYVGGKRTYTVVVVASGKESAVGTALSANYPRPRLRPPVYGDDGAVTFTWPETPFSRGLRRYQVLRLDANDPVFGAKEVVYETTVSTDTTYVANHRLFGDRAYYQLKVDGHQVGYSGEGETEVQEVAIGDSVAWGDEPTTYLRDADAYLRVIDGNGQIEFRLYDADTKALLKESEIPALQPTAKRQINGRYSGLLMRDDQTRVYSWNRGPWGDPVIQAFDTSTLRRTATYDLSDVIPGYLFMRRAWIGANGLFFTQLGWVDGVTHSSHALLVLDLETMTPVAFLDRPDYEEEWRLYHDFPVRRILGVAPSGKYFMMNDERYERWRDLHAVADTVEHVGRWRENYDGYLNADFPDGPDHVMRVQDGTVEIWSLPQRAMVRAFDVDPDLLDVSYDLSRNHFYGTRPAADGTATFLVYDAYGTVLHEIPVVAHSTYRWTGGTLWSGSLYLDVSRP